MSLVKMNDLELLSWGRNDRGSICNLQGAEVERHVQISMQMSLAVACGALRWRMDGAMPDYAPVKILRKVNSRYEHALHSISSNQNSYRGVINTSVMIQSLLGENLGLRITCV